MKKNNYLAKHDDFVVANYDFNLETQKLFFACLYKMNCSYIKPIENELSYIYRLDFDEIKSLIGVDYAIENHKEVMKRAKKDLTEKSVEIKTKNGYQITGIIKTFEVDEIEKTVLIEISKRILPYFVDTFRKFTKFGFKHLTLCESKYTLRLYEILITKSKTQTYDKKRVVNITIDEIRETLKIPKSYNYTNIKTLIFEKSLIEFNALNNKSIEEKLENKLFKSFEYKEIIEKKRGRGRRPVSHIEFEFELLEETKSLMMSKNEKVKKELESEDWIFTELRILIDKNRERDSFFEKLEINYIYGVVIEIIEQIKADYEVFGNLNQMLIKNSLNSSFSRFTSKHRSADFISYLKNGFIWNCDNYLSKNKSLQEN